MLFVTLIFLFLFLTIEFFERIRMFLSNHATMAQMFSYLLLQIPIFLPQILPAVILLASLLTFGNLSRHSEIIALKANGVTFFASPYLPLPYRLSPPLQSSSSTNGSHRTHTTGPKRSTTSRCRNARDPEASATGKSGIGEKRGSTISAYSMPMPMQ